MDIHSKILFTDDYSEGCHPRIIEALSTTNMKQEKGYGWDSYSIEAKELIRQKINCPKAKICFISGGTQTNLIAMAAFLRPHESVIAAETGHIAVNEAGAIESNGHKVNTIVTEEGKLTPKHVQRIIDAHQNTPHQVKPKLVYISNSTEVGTFYTKSELIDLYTFCQLHGLLLFLDGARLGHALTAEGNDLTMAEVAQFTDAFYVGGTKNGALLGEALVITKEELKLDIEFIIKQKGAMLAKGRLIGIQFRELFRDDLFFDLAKIANTQASRIKANFKELGCKFWKETNTNQIFPILHNDEIEKLSKGFGFRVWKKIDENHSAIRIITSWASRDEDIETFIGAMRKK